MIKLKKLLTEATFRVTFDIEDAKLGRYTTDVQAKDKKDAEKKVAAKFVGGEKLITKGKTKKIKESVVENKSDKKTFDKIVKALKDIKVKATIHLNDEDKITIALGRDYFRKKKLITFHENVIYSEKVFKINAVLKWCFSQIQNKKMSFALWEKNKKFLAQYVAGIVDIEWGDNSFSVIEIENDQEPRTKNQ